MSENIRRPGEVSKPPPGLAATPTLEGALAVGQDSESPAGGVDEGLREALRAVLDAGPDTWTPYDSRDCGEVFLADSVRDFVVELRAMLSTDRPAGDA